MGADHLKLKQTQESGLIYPDQARDKSASDFPQTNSKTKQKFSVEDFEDFNDEEDFFN